MKRIYQLIAVAALLVSGNEVFAQGQSYTATASATATIVTPIQITNVLDMNFGNIAVGNAAGTVLLSPAGGRTPSGGVTLPATTGTVSSATFNVTGEANYTYVITLPTGTFTLNGPSSNTMTIGTFTSTTTSGTATLSSGGTDGISVGATLSVGASQATGVYTSATEFPVTVNYN
jgi:hypothetical protein